MDYEASMWVGRVLSCFMLLAVFAAFVAALVATGRAKKDGIPTLGPWLVAGGLGIGTLNTLCFFGLDFAEITSDAYLYVALLGMLVELATTAMLIAGVLLLRLPGNEAAAEVTP